MGGQKRQAKFESKKETPPQTHQKMITARAIFLAESFKGQCLPVVADTEQYIYNIKGMESLKFQC